jgi:hypothetical protein
MAEKPYKGDTPKPKIYKGDTKPAKPYKGDTKPAKPYKGDAGVGLTQKDINAMKKIIASWGKGKK